MPANDYWVNNRDNTFGKENKPATGMMPAATIPKTGTMPEMSIPKPANVPMDNNQVMAAETKKKQYGNRQSVTVPIMGEGTMQGELLPPMMPGMARAASIPAGTPELVRATQRLGPTGVVGGAIPQPSGSMIPPGSYATCEMAQTPGGVMSQGMAMDQLQARCGRVTDLGYIQGFLRTQIGRHVKIEFVVGTNMFIDREGFLVDVGIDYLIINELNTDDYLLCDMYSIKFVKIYF